MPRQVKSVKETPELDELRAENEMLNKRLAAVMAENAVLRNMSPVAVLGFWDGSQMRVTGVSPRDLTGEEVLNHLLRMQRVVLESSLRSGLTSPPEERE